MFKLAKIASAMAAALALTACGGGGGSDDTSLPTEELQPEGQSLSGRAADGYLSGARVCLDLNANSMCDDGEPTTESTSGGEYSFADLPADLDLSNVRVVVEAIAGSTIDEDNPGVPLEKGFTLTAPPGQTAFVSPITTMIDVQMKNSPDLDITQAEEVVKQQLGVSGAADIDLMADYVASKQAQSNQSEQAEYERLHTIAQAVTHSLADNLTTIEQATGGVPAETSFEATLGAVVSQIVSEVDQIASAIDEAAATGEEIDPQALAEELKEQLQLVVEELQQVIAELEEKREATLLQMQHVLTQDGGIYFLESDEYHYYDHQTNRCVVEKELGYGQFRVEDEQSEWLMRLFNPVTGQFSIIDERDDPHYVLLQGQWQRMQAFEPQLQGFEDNAVLISLPGDGDQRITAKQIPLAGQPLAKIADEDEVWADHLALANTTFPEGAEAYLLTSEQISDHHVIPVWDECDSSYQVGSNCNAVRVNGEPVSNWDQLLNTEWHDDSAQQAKMFSLFGHDQELLVALVEITHDDHVEHFAKLFKPEYCADGTACGELDLVGVGDWYISDDSGAELLYLVLPSWLQQGWLDDDGQLFLARQGDAIRLGVTFQRGDLEHDGLAMNKAAMDAVLQAFEPDELRWELAPQACGYYEHGDDDHNDDGSKGEEGDDNTNDPVAEPVPVKPELIADAQMTELLAGKVYFGHADEETVLIQFAGFDDMIVFWQDQEDDGTLESGKEMAHWLADAEQQLLLDFGEDDWALLKATEGFGQSSMVLEESGGNDINLFVLNQVIPFTPDYLVTGGSFTLAANAEDNCQLQLHLHGYAGVSEGSGWIDATACADTAEEMGQQFEVMWSLGHMGELVLTPVLSTGEIDDEMVHLFIREHSTGTEMIMVFEPRDHEQWEWEAFETWRLIQE